MEEDGFQLYLINAGVFLGSFVLTFLLRKIFKGFSTALILLFASTVIYYVHNYSKLNTASLYKDYGVPRCSSSRDINTRFKQLSKSLHPDKQQQSEKVASFEKTDEIKDFLLNANKRLFYDKFNRIFERQDFDDKETKEVFGALIQRLFLSYLNKAFYLIIVLFILGFWHKLSDLSSLGSKIVVAKSMILMYYVYNQKLDHCSVLDLFFPTLSIHYQSYYTELILNFLIGIFFVFLKERYEIQKNEMLSKIDTLNKSAVNLSEGLKSKLEEFKNLINK